MFDTMFGVMIFMVWIHFLADFIFQRRTVALGKSSEMILLNEHWLIVFFVTYLGSLIIFRVSFGSDEGSGWDPVIFSLMISVVHAIQDYFVWNSYKGIRKDSVINYWEDKLFYTYLGLDQMLHITWILLVLKHFEGDIPSGWG